jgi:hypothetical protein
MTSQCVNKFFDESERVAHRLMLCNINEKYSYINGDVRCAATYINDPKGSGQLANVIFEFSNVDENNALEYLIPIKTLREIISGEELLVEYGNLFFNEVASTEQSNITDNIINNQITNNVSEENNELKEEPNTCSLTQKSTSSLSHKNSTHISKYNLSLKKLDHQNIQINSSSPSSQLEFKQDNIPPVNLIIDCIRTKLKELEG